MDKFIVFSQQRAGSHYLRYLLNAHKDIHCNSDLSSGDIGKRGFDWTYARGFKTHRTDVKLVGFLAKLKQNLHYDIARYPDVKVIFLLRRDRLATMLSRMVASAFGCYDETGLSLAVAKRKRSELFSVKISIEEAEEFFNYWEEKEAEVFLFLEDHPDWNTIYYEDLSDGISIQLIYDWLGVSLDSSKLVEQKQGRGFEKLDPRPIEEAIENYEELTEYFKDKEDLING